ncbi:hypothetical protein B0A81_04115 [Flavobacterium plurextorum]|uniref:Uncharacterized protein n=1 Tax=Flavobacterium plurextorum TaxID=1114867 RepID=A0ABX4CXY6_9FLAO|nr:hypothetical protein [Flavobacterium plurextorum]OXB10201.1 hypothetical protein B0A81_04115 [Flavobacterium plurextorum]
MLTIFSAVSAFVLAYKADIATKVIASATYDVLKNTIDFSSLKERIKKFFKNETEVDTYLETICSQKSVNTSKPQRDIEDVFESVTGEKYNEDIFSEIKEWIKENESVLTQVSTMKFNNTNGFNIGVQNAKKNIINISGDYKPNQK